MRVGIIGAMEVEVERLQGLLAEPRVFSRAGMDFWEGVLGGVTVVVVKCGIGKVNAGICAQVLADVFDVTHVINTGIAGSLDNAIEIGDVVVSTDAVHHDFDLQNFGYPAGKLPDVDVLAFPADPTLRAAAHKAIAEAAPEIGAHDGRVASGDQFIRTQDEKDRITSTFGARCCEMEGASIAHACYLNGIPFVIVRAISDKADGSSSVDYPTFEREAAHNCARIVERMVAYLGGVREEPAPFDETRPFDYLD